MKPSEILALVYAKYEQEPFLVQNQSYKQCWSPDGHHVVSGDLAARVDAALSSGSKCFPYIRKLVYGHLFAAVSETGLKFSGSKPLQRAGLLLLFNDRCTELSQIEDVLLCAYLMALSEEDPSEGHATRHKIDLADAKALAIDAGAKKVSLKPTGVAIHVLALNVKTNGKTPMFTLTLPRYPGDSSETLNTTCGFASSGFDYEYLIRNGATKPTIWYKALHDAYTAMCEGYDLDNDEIKVVAVEQV